MSLSNRQKTFKGYGVTDTKNWSDLSLIDFPSKNWEETDIEVAITHCGVCGSDIHTISSGWGPIDIPLVAGHEIVGTAVRVGSQVKSEIKVGDRVGVGAQIYSCGKCKFCQNDNENYCKEAVDTYNAEYPDGVKTFGGYATGIIANERFIFPIPDALESSIAASMLCAGLTVYSPLKRNGCGPGKKVGIIGVGGLGHYAVMFAAALGAEVYVFSHTAEKEEDVKKMGAHHFILTKNDFQKKLPMELDLIISTCDNVDGLYLEEYLSTLDVHGKFISVGLPNDPLPNFSPKMFLPNGSFFGGSHIGSKKEALEMLDLAASTGIKPWIEELPMCEVKKAIEGVKHGKPRYRYILKQDIA